IVLWPMVAKQYRDTKKIRSIQPRLDDLKEKFKDKPTEMAKAQQTLYKEIDYNPLGCLTNFIIQIPILIALYQSVLAFTKSGVTPLNMPGLYPFVAEKLIATGQAIFSTDLFGIQLLASPGSTFTQGFFTSAALPYLFLLALLAVSNLLPTLVSMKLMNTQVPKVKKVGEKKTDTESMQDAFSSSLNTSTLYVMPLMLTLSMTPLPSIVSVYMIAQNIVSTAQQLLVKYFHDTELKKKLVAVLIKDHGYAQNEAVLAAIKLLRLAPAINFLADELGQFGSIKTTSVKVHDITFATVLSKRKKVVDALFLFDRMARTPDKAEELLNEK
ncbi:MAG: YidC/Oxa1 family membrane protein insertase, partial [Candidatus Magasanikiibacteriota bacterium]